jgi:hypothetical protein
MDAFLSTALDRLERNVVEPLSAAAIELVDEQLSEFPEASKNAGALSGVTAASSFATASTPAKTAASTSTSNQQDGAFENRTLRNPSVERVSLSDYGGACRGGNGARLLG